MASPFRRILRALTPYGAVDWLRKWQIMRSIGYDGSPWNFVDVNRTYWAARRAGFDMLPNGALPTIHTLVDVGANHGRWTESALTCVSPETAVLLEPEPNAFQTLTSKFQGRSNVRLHNTVAGETPGVIDFHVTASDDLSSVLTPNESLTRTLGDHSSVQAKIERDVRPLDDLLDDLVEISFLKVDVQGFELPVLRGAKETLKKTRFLLIEMNYFTKYEGGSDFTAVHQHLTDAGFQLRDFSEPAVVNGRATFSDALYQNPDCL
jgi:FkbM family methyltransferase